MTTQINDLLSRLRGLQGADLPVHGGRTLAYVYDAGDPEVDRLGREAVASYAGSNALDPTAFPSLLQMENELVGWGCRLTDAPDEAVGSVTSGGTESILLAVLGAREARPGLARPNLVIPETAHAAFLKAALYFGVEARQVPVGSDHRADPEAMIAAIDDDTILVALSAPSYAHGVIDPIAEVAAAAEALGIRCHVDACIGGWVLPYASRVGRDVTPWSFAVPGVTSISVDTHKYAYAPKGTSLLLHRNSELRRPQFFASAAWPGYTMLNATMQSTRSGGPIAGAWAVVNAIGDAGYEELTRQVLAATEAIVAAVEATEGLHVVAAPDSTLVAVGTDDSCDPFTVAEELVSRGWYVQPQLSFGEHPATIHLSVSAGTLAHVEEFSDALHVAAAAAREAGPLQIDPEILGFIEDLDPAGLGPDEFDGLLMASGLITIPGTSAEPSGPDEEDSFDLAAMDEVAEDTQPESADRAIAMALELGLELALELDGWAIGLAPGGVRAAAVPLDDDATAEIPVVTDVTDPTELPAPVDAFVAPVEAPVDSPVEAPVVAEEPEGTSSLVFADRMAEVNAMLDAASPQMREALMIAFLDRLQRPLR